MRHTIGSGLLALSLGVAPGLAAQPDEGQARERLDAIGEEIRGLAGRLAETRTDRDDADRALREVETELATTHRRLDRLQAERGELGEEIEALRTRRDDLDRRREAEREALSAQLDALYRLGTSPQLKLLLNQDDPARLDRLQHYLNRLSRARDERLERLERLDAALMETRETLAERGERLDALAGELAERSAELADQVARRAELLADLDRRHADEAARMASLTADRTRAEAVLRDVQEQLSRLERPPPSTAIDETRGELPWPVQGAIVSRFRDGDGVHRNGLVIEVGEGTPVRAVHAGRVVFADWMRGFGNLLIVDHGDQIMTLHAHLQHFAVSAGEAVARDDTLGAVGASGGQDDAALYFEVRRGGEPIDPQGWIAGR